MGTILSKMVREGLIEKLAFKDLKEVKEEDMPVSGEEYSRRRKQSRGPMAEMYYYVPRSNKEPTGVK